MVRGESGDRYKRIVTRARHVIDIVFYVIFTLLLVYAVFSLVGKLSGRNITFFGYKPVIVVSGSMEPVIETNSLVIIRTCDIEDVDIGDIVVYRSESKGVQIIHRIVENIPSNDGITYRTKGDANKSADTELVTSENIVGKVVTTCNWTSDYLRHVVINGKVSLADLFRTGLIIFLTIWLIYIILIVAKNDVSESISAKKKTDTNDTSDNKEEK